MNIPIQEFDAQALISIKDPRTVLGYDLNKIFQFGRIRIYFHESVECTGFASKIVVVNSLANDESITTDIRGVSLILLMLVTGNKS